MEKVYNEEFLSEGEILKCMIDYVYEEIYNYALMLDGKWGTGKTYFIINKFKKEIENDKEKNKKVIYISLYGIKDIEEISNLINSKIIELILGDKAKFLPFINSATLIFAEKLGISELVEPIKNAISDKTIKWEEYIFIFDDFERCSLSINIVFGYINQIVEQKELKVIIVANQDEIGILNIENNLELKYLVAAQKNIIFTGENDKNIDNLNLSVLKEKVNYLFEENELYKKIREKLIGRTIYYYPNLKKVLLNLLDKNFNEFKMKEIIEPIIDSIVLRMEKDKYYNIRTIQFILVYLKQIIDLNVLNNDKDINEQIIQEIFIDALRISIFYNKGGEKYIWQENKEYGVIRLSKSSDIRIDNFFQSFRFTHTYINSGSFNKEKISKILYAYINEITYEKNNKNDPFVILQTYWDLDDDIIENEIEILKENIFKETYEISKYPDILRILYILKSIGFDNFKIEEIKEKMKESIKDEANIISSYRQVEFDNKNPFYDEYIKSIDELDKTGKQIKYNNKKEEINSIFCAIDDNWGANLHKYWQENKFHFMSIKGFFSLIDIDYFFKKLHNTTTKEFSDFRRAMGSMYDFQNIKDYFILDKDNLLLLKNKLEQENYPEKIKEYNKKELIKYIGSILQRLT